jgi:indolepyruvate decarboxylase
MKAIIIVLDNALYAIEQQLIDPGYFSSPTGSPNPFMVLNRWNYGDLATAMGFQLVQAAADPAALVTALNDARSATGPVFITATMNPKNLPAGLS